MSSISITALTLHKVVKEKDLEKPGGTIQHSYNLRGFPYILLFETLSYLRSENYAKVVVHPITPTEEEKMAGTDATLEDESKGVVKADQDFEATLSSELKWKAKKGYHTRV
ncbi:hypothetical protein D8674_011638 [Pyrus ussuriensis x Pyrus communis]|uniref:Uncharacterized protein n=1 Tax=Pyrus ussuriensis x Pyrus communis TaxID=2448454 RepID=A0A5N5G453_9ROSA|nr:hypothetical protein D8674_011638 [Pyrus ussuriensis x Pyrus communis]